MSNFDQFDSMELSLKGEQPYEVQKKGKQKSYMCKYPECGKVFRYHSEILRHIATHSDTRPYVCDFESCAKSFKRKDALENHVRTHTNDKPFVCPRPDCDQRFATKASLRYHLLKHDGQREYVCSFPGCGKTFVTISQLKQHENSSTVHKNIKVSFQPEPYISIFANEEPPIEKKTLPSEFESIFNAWDPIVGTKTEPQAQQSQEQEAMFAGFSMYNSSKPPENAKAEELERYQKENDALKRRLDEAQKYISVMHQRNQNDPFSLMEYFSGNDMFGTNNLQNMDNESFYRMDQQ